MNENVIVVVPARLKSTRLPGKMLEDFGGVPLIVASAKNAQKSGFPVVVATDSEQIQAVCAVHGIDALLTPQECESGTDRIAFLVRTQQWGNKYIVNVQGDEPLLEPDLINRVLECLVQKRTHMATVGVTLESLAQWHDPNCVKVVVGAAGNILYFSRVPVPYDREGAPNQIPPAVHRHLGIYGYTGSALMLWDTMHPSLLEHIEKLEQWRALENGLSMSIVLVPRSDSISIDTLSDLQLARRRLQE